MSKRKEFTGTVISNRMQKTIIVKVSRLAKHQKYSRTMRLINKFKAHDEKNSAQVGDVVKILETRPLSKDKRFRLVEIVKKSLLPHVEIKEEIPEIRRSKDKAKDKVEDKDKVDVKAQPEADAGKLEPRE